MGQGACQRIAWREGWNDGKLRTKTFELRQGKNGAIGLHKLDIPPIKSGVSSFALGLVRAAKQKELKGDLS